MKLKNNQRAIQLINEAMSLLSESDNNAINYLQIASNLILKSQ